MKSFISIACLLLVAAMAVEARPKRSVILASPAVVATAPVVASVPVASVVHHNPTTVVKTEQVHSGVGSSYSYSTEVKSQPAVAVRSAVVASPVVAAAAPAAVVSTVHHAVPATYAYAYGYPHYAYPHYGYAYASPYSYVVGK